eukprot:UN06857
MLSQESEQKNGEQKEDKDVDTIDSLFGFEDSQNSAKKSFGSQNALSQFSNNNNNNKKKKRRDYDMTPQRDGVTYVPIDMLHPYIGKWTIKIRVVDKDDAIREWNKNGRSGKLFSFIVMDCHFSKIGVTAFNAEAEKFFESIEIDKVYAISKANIKTNRYKGRIKHDYAINLHSRTIIEEKQDDSFPKVKYEFKKLSDLLNIGKDSEKMWSMYVDIVGVVKSVEEKVSQFTSKKGNECRKRTLTLVDDSCASIEVSLWFSLADKYGPEELKDNPVIVLPGARLTGFGGRSLTASRVLMKEESEEVSELQKWWTEGGHEVAFTPLTTAFNMSSAERLSHWEQVLALKKGSSEELADFLRL